MRVCGFVSVSSSCCCAAFIFCKKEASPFLGATSPSGGFFDESGDSEMGERIFRLGADSEAERGRLEDCPFDSMECNGSNNKS